MPKPTAVITDVRAVSFTEVAKSVAKVLKKEGVETKIYDWQMKKIPEENVIFVGNIFHLSISYLQRFLPEKNVVFYAITEGVPILDSMSLQIADSMCFVTPSAYTKGCLEQANIRVSEIIQHGVDLNPTVNVQFHNYIRERLPQPSKVQPSNVILNISGNVQRKALDKQMIAFKTIEHTIRDSFLLLHSGVGDTNIVALQNALELKRFWFTNMWGVLDSAKIQALYELCDFYCQPSLCEGFGLTYLEAFTHKKPVIGVDCSGVSEIVKDSYTGLLLNVTKTEQIVWQQRHAIQLHYFDIDDLIRAMLVLSDKKIREGMVKNIEIEIRKWDMNTMYKQFVRLLT